ncbi:MAG: hypothetical protein J6P07_04540, partial [Spirochaetaceae bacterium]|nr:hypothetical protein [Spirochaetaceae bacterium]
MHNAIETINSKEFPFDVEGINGGLQGFFIGELARNRLEELSRELQYGNKPPLKEAADFLLIVPTEKDAETLISDLEGAFPPVKDKKTGKEVKTAEILSFPWWELVPYRPASKGSLVFGERAALLAKLSQSGVSFRKDSVPRF